MATYLNGLYEKRGGDQALRERHAKLIQWASEDGVLDKARKASIPDEIKGAFARLTDVVQREEFAVAGVWDVLSGTADEGDTVGGRFTRELLGGTKLGNMLGVEDDRAKEAFADVLEQRGVPEGKRLSDVIGDDWKVIKYFDPSARETAGLALAIFGSPSTYLTFGAGGAAKWVGKAGTVRVTSKANKLAHSQYTKLIERNARRYGVKQADPIMREAEVLSRIATKGEKSKATIATQAVVKQELEYQAQSRTADILSRMGRRARTEGYTTDRAIRFAGMRVASLEPELKAGTELFNFAKRVPGVGLPFRAIDEFVGAADRVFQRIPRGARKYEAFRRADMRRHAQKQSAVGVSDALVNEALGARAIKVLSKNEQLNDTFMRAVDEENIGAWIDAAKAAGLDRESAIKAFEGWANLADELGLHAVHNNLLEMGQFEKFRGRYFPRVLKPEYAKRFENDPMLGYRGGSIGQYGRSRKFDTQADLEEWLQLKGVDPGEAIDKDVVAVLKDYTERHYKGVAEAQFAKEVAAKLSSDVSLVLRETAGEFARLPKVTAEVADEMDDIISTMMTRDLQPLEVAQTVSKLNKLDGTQRAHVLHEAFSRVESLDEFDRLVSRYNKSIDKTSINAMSKLNDARIGAIKEGEQTFTFSKGPYKGKTLVLPRAVAEVMEANQSALKSRLPDELSRMLKHFDFLQNSFKRLHTIIFPSFHNRNIISNTAEIAVQTNIAAQLDLKLVNQVIRAMTNTGDFTLVAKNGARYPREQLHGLLNSLDVVAKRGSVEEMTGEGIQEALSRVKVLQKVDAAVGTASQSVENFARAMYFMQQLKSGTSSLDAALNVKRVLFDYSDLSFAQREVIRRLFPFATWTMKNVELQVKNLATKPGRVAAQIRVANQGERGPEADLLPNYMRGEMKIKLRDQPGKAGTFITGIDLPINNVDVLWAGGVGKTMREHWNMFTPILKAPLEYMLNLDTFSGQPIRGRRWLGEMGPRIERAWPKKLKEFIELEKIVTSDGREVYKANGLRMWALTKNIFLGRIFNEATSLGSLIAELYDGDVEGGAKSMMKFLSGMRFEEMDFTEAQRDKLRRTVRDLEKFLLEEGSVADFSRTFRPASKKQSQGLFGGLQ